MIDQPSADKPDDLVDWFELTLLKEEGLRAISMGEVIEIIRVDFLDDKFDGDATNEDEFDIPSGAGVEDEALTITVEGLFSEFRARSTTAAAVYPFEVDGDRIATTESAGRPVYELLLTLSLEELPKRKAKKLHEIEHAFDHVIVEASRRYLGRKRAKGIRFARRASDGAPDEGTETTRPRKFSDAVAWLSGTLGCPRGPAEVIDDDNPLHVDHWEAAGGIRAADIPNRHSDAGVDVIAWWNFDDNALGFPVLLVQCTVQKNWSTKTKDVSVALWQSWINFGTTPPQKALAIPFAINKEKYKMWDARVINAGVVWDRFRILELLSESEPTTISRILTAEDKAWVRDAIQEACA